METHMKAITLITAAALVTLAAKLIDEIGDYCEEVNPYSDGYPDDDIGRDF